MENQYFGTTHNSSFKFKNCIVVGLIKYYVLTPSTTASRRTSPYLFSNKIVKFTQFINNNNEMLL